MRELHPETWMWTHTDYLLALVFDKLSEHNWMISKDGAKGMRRPKPLPRPGLVDPDNEITRIRGQAIPMDEMQKRLGDRAPFQLHAV